MHAVRHGAGTRASGKCDPPHRPPPPARGLPVWDRGTVGILCGFGQPKPLPNNYLQLGEHSGAQAEKGSPLGARTGRLEPGQPYCPPCALLHCPGARVTPHTPLPVHLTDSVFIVICLLLRWVSRGRDEAGGDIITKLLEDN